MRIGDMLMARSGEGTIGKTALFERDEPCLFSDFTMRLRFSDAMSPRFAWYFFRSIMFQSQVEREKRGMGNMVNIFPSQVAELRIVAIERARQDSLADEIAAVLEALQHEREDIEARRQEIENLLEAALGLHKNSRKIEHGTHNCCGSY
jgi:type I restriction enzyme, S subunit